MILVGIALGIVGAFIFLVLPRLLSGGSGTNITNYVLVGLLLAVLIGLVLVSIGLVPVFEAIIAQFLRPFIKKYYPIYKINLYRYRRRNYGNIVMFALTMFAKSPRLLEFLINIKTQSLSIYTVSELIENISFLPQIN